MDQVLFVLKEGQVAFWKISRGSLVRRTLSGNRWNDYTSSYWDEWSEANQAGDSVDAILLSDRPDAYGELPQWFYGAATKTSKWTLETFSKIVNDDEFTGKGIWIYLAAKKYDFSSGSPEETFWFYPREGSLCLQFAEEMRLAEAKRMAEEMAAAAEAKRKAEEARRAAEDRRKREAELAEAKRKAEEMAAAAEARRKAEEEEARRKAREEKAAAEAKCKAAEEEARRKAREVEERRRRAAEEEARIQQSIREEFNRKEAEKEFVKQLQREKWLKRVDEARINTERQFDVFSRTIGMEMMNAGCDDQTISEILDAAHKKLWNNDVFYRMQYGSYH